MRAVLVTGGAGYIGSHVCKALSKAGYLPITFDNLSHGHEWAVRWGPLFHGDLQNLEDLDQAFSEYEPIAVIHLAGSIHLRESIENPHKHYYNNVVGSLALFKTMVKHRVLNLVFSSSAAVYAPPQYLPLDEVHLKGPINPYGKTKWMTEQILEDFEVAHGMHSIILRYFNAAGADPEGELGEAHHPETHLIPRVIFTALKKQHCVTIYNHCLPTNDGTAVRDYVHVSDLASAHVKGLQRLLHHQKSEVFNLGSGKGYSVLEIIKKAEEITGLKIEIELRQQQFAEPPILVADPRKAKDVLGWTPEYSELEQILETAWRWHSNFLPSTV